MIVKNSNDKNLVELTLLKDIYKEENDTYILVKKDIKVKRLVSKYDIVSVEEDLSSLGKPYKNRVKLHLRGEEPIICEGKYTELKKLINPTEHNPVGFVIGKRI